MANHLAGHHQTALACSHALAAWGQRMWEFAVGLILIDKFPSNFAAVAVAGVVMSLSQACCGASVGEFLDRCDTYLEEIHHAACHPSSYTRFPHSTPRLWGASLMYIIQNLSVAFSAAAALLLLSLPNTPTWVQVSLVVAFIAGVACHVCCVVYPARAGAGTADLGSLGSTLAVERDWVKILSAGDSAMLASMNAGTSQLVNMMHIVSSIPLQ